MDLIKHNFKTGIVQLRVTDLDDLWYLRQIIDPGDLITGKTTRKVKIGDSENAKVVKKTLTLKVEAETIEFGEDNSSLRVNGRIREGPEDIPRDSYHAITLSEGTEFTIQKTQWLSYQRQKLEEAAEKRFSYLLCLFDREEALFALTKKYGFEVLVKIKGEVPKKDKAQQITKDFQQEIIKALDVYAGRYNPEHIILASPAFYKEDLVKKIKDKELLKKIVLGVCSEVDESALNEVMRRPELAATLKDSKAREEQLLVEELLTEINKQGKAVYGWQDVKNAAASGAIQSLLITDAFIQKKREEGKFAEVDELLKVIDTLQAPIHIISTEHDGGQRLSGLSGIAALLRYKLS
ncbi:mRNA surveillance protein pelota [Candidatus Woesearchaeota archaeon CG10_big_fil_rev_8_21_14_0_10_45_16]|nr:MAG: mRNA surveillance protein pelota [Candidatus Woesearchaeota archaeon CG10_big_fil_rev_8_21_14_0_10_45_16]